MKQIHNMYLVGKSKKKCVVENHTFCRSTVICSNEDKCINCHNPSPSQKSKVKRTCSDSILLFLTGFLMFNLAQIVTVDSNNQDTLI